jgi:hypothetical protein
MPIDHIQGIAGGLGGEKPKPMMAGLPPLPLAPRFNPEGLLLVVAEMNLDQRQRLLDLLGLKGEPATRGRPLTEDLIREIRDKVTAEARRKMEEDAGVTRGTLPPG